MAKSYSEIKASVPKVSGESPFRRDYNEKKRLERMSYQELKSESFDFNLDQDYINSFIKDSQEHLKTSQKDYEGTSYKNAKSNYENYNKRSSDLKARASNIRVYLNANKSKIDESAYNELMSYLDAYKNDSNNYFQAFYKAQNYYSQWEDEESYNRDYDNYTYSNKYKGKSYADLMTAKDVTKRKVLKATGDELDALNRELSWIDNHKTDRQFVDTMSDDELKEYKSGNETEIKELKDKVSKLNTERLAFERGGYTANQRYQTVVKELESAQEKLKELNSGKSNILYYDEAGAVTVDNILTSRENEGILAKINGDEKTKIAYEKALEANANISEISNKIYDLGVEIEQNDYHNVDSTYQIDQISVLNKQLKENRAIVAEFESLGYDLESLEHYKRNKESRASYADTQEEYYNYGKENWLGAKAYSTFVAPIGSILDLASNKYEEFEYGYANVHDDEYINKMSAYSSATAESTGDAFEQAALKLGASKNLSEGIGTVASIADSGISSAIQSGVTGVVATALCGGNVEAGATVALSILGTQAASSTYSQKIREGSTNEEATLTALASGIAEAMFESIPLDNLFKVAKNGGIDTVSALLKTMAKQSAIEGFEELGTEVTNAMADNIINGDHSSYETAVRKYMSQGYSETDARNMATSEWMEEVLTAFAGGMFGGLFMGGTASTSSYAINKAHYNQMGEGIVEKGNVPQLVSDAKSIDGASDKLLNLANEVAGVKTENMSKHQSKNYAHDVGQLYKGVQKEQAKSIGKVNSATLKAALVKELNENSVENAETVADALVKATNKGRLTKSESKLVADANGLSVLSKVLNTIQKSQEHKDKVEQATIKTFETTTLPYAKADSTIQRETLDVSGYEISKDGTNKVSATGDEVKINRIVSFDVGNDDVNVALDNGENISIAEMSINEDTAVIINGLKALNKNNGMNVETANTIMAMFNKDMGIDAKTFILGAETAYRLAYSNAKPRLAKDVFTSQLPANIRESIYELGRKTIVDKVNAEQTIRDNLKKNGKPNANAGKVTFKDVTRSELTKEQKAMVDYAQFIANTIGFELEIFRSPKDASGRSKGHSGSWNGSVMTLDVDAGEVNGVSLMVITQSHELTHLIKTRSPKEFNLFADMLFEKYGKISGARSIDSLILDKIKSNRNAYIKEVAELKKQGKDASFAKHKEELSYDEAKEEVVASLCENFLKDSNAYEFMQEIAQKDKGLFNRIKQFIQNLVERLKNAIKAIENSNYKSLSNELQKLAKEDYQELVDKWTELLLDSRIENTTQSKEQSNISKDYLDTKDVMHHLRYTDTHLEDIDNYYDENAAMVSKEVLKERYAKVIDIWKELGGELNSKFLNDWNNKELTDRAFTIFKAQAGYKYNVELSSMCKKGVPLFEAIDTIVKKEVASKLKIDKIGKAEKEILYDILKAHSFEIPCAICYVEQARQREGEIIDAFVNGKVDKDNKGNVVKVKLGWNQVLTDIQNEMKANGVDYTFPTVDESIKTDAYVPTEINMDAETQEAFYNALVNLTNKEINRYFNEERAADVAKGKLKKRPLLKSASPSEVKRCLSRSLPSNLALLKTMFTEPSSRFFIEDKALYSSHTTRNLAMSHQAFYSLFNRQGGVSGYKTKQAPIVYLGDILKKKWKPSTLRKEGGVRNQSNSDFQMYQLVDYMQMLIDFSAKGYYLQAYTKVIAELKLFGLSGGKYNASLIPKVHLYKNADGTVNVEKTKENAGLDENGELLFDNVEGIISKEAFMLISDEQYSKNVCGICIGYSDKHIEKMLDDNRIQLIIGFHDKTDDGEKRYAGARYANNYNGLNEAVDKNGTTKHIGFNPFVAQAEKLFNYNVEKGTHKDVVEHNGREYTVDDIPKLAADLYLEHCESKKYTPAYYNVKLSNGESVTTHPNFYKLLADFGLKDAKGHYAPHRKVQFNMPDTVPYLDINGKKKYMPTKDYIKKELQQELAVRDRLAEELADTSENGIIPQFVEQVNALYEKKTMNMDRDSTPLESRVTGDDLLDAQDLIETIKSVGGTVTDDGYVTLYHRTSKENAEKIIKSGFMIGKEDGLFFSTNKSGYNDGYGDTAVEFSIPVEKVMLDDIFDNEAHLRLAMSKAGKMSVKRYLVTTSVDAVEMYQDRDSEGNKLTPEQAEFFKDSKVRDEEGNLLVMWHGTSAKFTVFDIERAGQNWGGDSRLGKGFYFAKTEEEANEWSQSVNSVKAYLNLVNPLDLTAKAPKNIAEEIDKYFEEKLSKYDEKTFVITKEQYSKNLQRNKEMYLNNPSFFVDLFKYDDNGNMTDGIREFLSSLGYDGIIAMDEVVAFYPNQIKLVDNLNPTENEDIRYQDREISRGKLTQERIDYLIKYNSAGSRVDYARAWITTISPTDFLELTLPYETRVKDRDFFDTKVGGDHGSVMGDRDYIADLINEREMPYLEVDIDTGKVIGHNGRHRMRALEKAGAWKTPIQINLYKDGRLYKGDDNGVRLETIDSIKLKSQFDDEWYLEHKAYIHNIIPLNEDHREEIEKEFLVKPLEVKYGKVLAYMDRDETTSNIAEVMGLNKDLEKQNEKLKADVADLNELLKLQKKVTNGKMFTKSSVEKMATMLWHKFGLNRVNEDQKKELAQRLNAYYSYIAQGEELTWEEVMNRASEIARWVDDQIPEKIARDEYAQEILDTIKAVGVVLDDVQKQEVAHQYGSYNDFRKANMGSIKLVKDGVSLDSQWQEWAEMYPDMFDADMNPADMPLALVETIATLKATESVMEMYDIEEKIRSMAEEIYDGYWGVSTLYTVADKYQKDINILKSKHTEKMKYLRDNYANREKITKEKFNEMLKKVKADKDAKFAAYKELKKEQQKNATERRNKTATKNKLKRVINELNSILNNGTKERNVKIGLQETVNKALEMAGFLTTNFSNEEVLMAETMTDLTNEEKKLLKEYRNLVAEKNTLTGRINLQQKETENSNSIRSFELIDDLTDRKNKANDKLKRLEKKLSSVIERNRNKLNENLILNAIDSLAESYHKLKDSKDEFIKGTYNDYVYDRILTLKDSVKGTKLTDMTLLQLQEMYDVYKMILYAVRTSNELFLDGKKASVEEISLAILRELSMMKKSKAIPNEWLDKGKDAILKFNWNELKAYYAFNRIGSATLMKLYEDARKAEDVLGRDYNEAIQFAKRTMAKYGYDSWDMDKAYDVKLSSGKTIKLSLQELMSIYAYSKREQAYDHMKFGGFVFEGKKYFKNAKDSAKEIKTEEKSEEKAKEKIENMLTQTVREISEEAYRFDEKDLDTVKELIGDKTGFVDEMQDFLSTVMGAKGNEISRQLYGVDWFKEKHYFPLKSSHDFLAVVNQVSENYSLRNSGMTKATVPHAKNPIVLEDFMSVWSNHVGKMSTYHALVLPIDNLNKALSYKGQSISVKSTLKSVFGKSVEDYLDNFIKDLNGGITNQGATSPLAKMFGKFKKTAVSASTSVVVQQPTAIIRAMAYINPKYFKGESDKLKHKDKWNLIKKYAPIAVLKEIGGFDISSGRKLENIITSKSYKGAKKIGAMVTDSNYRDEVLMRPAGWADEFGWNIIWSAVEREIAKTTNLKTGTEEFYQECGKRFTEVVHKTQVYDSTFTKSGYQRSKSDLVKMSMAFMGEPTTSFNMMLDAVTQVARGNISKGKASQIIGATVASIIMAAVAKSFIYALRDDDEDESYAEKYASSLTDSLISDMHIHNMIPFVKDIISLFNGWDVERTDVAVFKDIKDALDGLESDSKSPYKKMEDLLGAIASAFGLPFKNLMRTGRELYNVFENIFDEDVASGEDIGKAVSSSIFGEDSMSKANDSLDKGNTTKAKKMIDDILNDKIDGYVADGMSRSDAIKKAKSSIRSSLTSEWKPRYLEAYSRGDMGEMNEIRKLLNSTGIYGSLAELDETLAEWKKTKD